MLIITATNVTPPLGALARPDGTSDYDVSVGVNRRAIWRGSVNGHKRADGATTLLRLIADRMDKALANEPKKW